jgi:hypothetical protein
MKECYVISTLVLILQVFTCFSWYCMKDYCTKMQYFVNSLTAKSVPAGTKLVLFGRYVLNIYVGIVQYIRRKTKTWCAKIYLPTQRTNRLISYDIN